MIGQTVSHYQIIEKLGAGGMGIVWKARDTRLNRFVALKMLPPDSHHDSERRQRFVQEAQAASALNHPNIITIYDIVQHDGADFIVMEHVAGRTLDAVIPRKRLRVGEILKIGTQIASALAAAHAAGIVHRDLKPGNVMVSESGTVKVLDFGLAKLTGPDAIGMEDATRVGSPRTAEGMVMGTAAYMSPEQAEAKPVDARSDIFSFGAILYESATGERAFAGESMAATLASVLHKDPAPLDATIPADLRRIISRCLRRDPRRRFQHADDLVVALEELREESDSGTLGTSVLAAAKRPPRRWIAAAALLVVGLGGAGVWWLARDVAAPAADVLAVPFTNFIGNENSPSFSPDGNQVVFTWNGEQADNTDVYLKLIGSPTALRLTSDPAPDINPAFAPDGRTVGFIRVTAGRTSLLTVPALGGPERVVADLAASVRTFAWLPGGDRIVTDGLAIVDIDTGESRPLTAPGGAARDYAPAVSPDGRAVAFARASSPVIADLYRLDLTTGLEPDGEPRRLTSFNGLLQGSAWTTDGASIILSVVSLGAARDTGLWKVPASGGGPPARLPFGVGDGFNPAVARTGNRLAYARNRGDINLWRVALNAPGTAGGMAETFLSSTQLENNANYSADGTRIVFASTRGDSAGLWIANADGSNAVERFAEADHHSGSPRWSPDGQYVAFDSNASGNWDVYTLRVAGGRPTLVAGGAFDEVIPSWSADGRTLYFASNRTGRYEIWKSPADGGPVTQVTTNGGHVAREALDGRMLYYTRGDDITSVWRMPVSGGPEDQVLPAVTARAFAPTRSGIYFAHPRGPDGPAAIQFLSFTSGTVTTVAAVTAPFNLGLTVSPDERTLVYAQTDGSGQDVMLVEDFR